MKYKVGDRVRVIHVDEDSLVPEMLHRVGTIVDVDTEWLYPYEVDFDNIKGLPLEYPDLYCDDDIELVTGEEANIIKFERIEYVDMDSAYALLHKGELVMYGDYYHDKIQDRMEGFFQGLDFAGIKYVVVDLCKGGDMYGDY